MGHWIIAAALAVYGGLLGVLLRRAGRPGGYLAEKTLCSAAFVALAALCARLGSRPEAFWKLLPALLCCVAGDVVLALFNRRRRPALFLLPGHLLLLAPLWQLLQLRVLLVLPLLSWRLHVRLVLSSVLVLWLSERIFSVVVHWF